MNEEFDPYKEFLAIIEERTRGSGVPSIGRILGVFLLETGPLDQQTIAEKSGYTVPHVSKTLRVLEELGYVEKTADITDKTGRPKLFYQLITSYGDFFGQVLVANLRILKHTENRLLSLYNALNSRKPAIDSSNGDEKVRRTTEGLLQHVTKLNRMIDGLIKELMKDT